MSPKYLSDVIPSNTRRYSSRNANDIPLVRANTNYFMNTFFPTTITKWNKLDLRSVSQIVLIYLRVDCYNL